MVNLKNKKYLIIIVAFILLAGASLIYIQSSQDTLSGGSKPTPTLGGASVNEDKGKPGNSSQDQPNDKSGSGDTGSMELLAPSGTFVSNHRPNIDGSPAPSKVSSTCNTTPGANCTISFTKDGITKSLPVKSTDREGAAYWEWDVADIGLTVGDWEITASANLNSQNKTANDSLVLVVAP